MDDEYDEHFFSIDQIWMEEELNYAENMLEDELLNENSENAVEEDTFNVPNETETQRSSHHRPHLNLEQRRGVVDCILALLEHNNLPRGSLTKLANKFGVHRSTISRIFKEVTNQRGRGELIDVSSKKLGKTGPKCKEYSDEWLQSVPLHKRTTIRSFAGALNISKTTVHRLKKNGKLRSHTSNNHPRVTHKHKLMRMQWVLSQIIPRTQTDSPTFNDMYNVIHIDENDFA